MNIESLKNCILCPKRNTRNIQRTERYRTIIYLLFLCMFSILRGICVPFGSCPSCLTSDTCRGYCIQNFWGCNLARIMLQVPILCKQIYRRASRFFAVAYTCRLLVSHPYEPLGCLIQSQKFTGRSEFQTFLCKLHAFLRHPTLHCKVPHQRKIYGITKFVEQNQNCPNPT